MDLGQRGRGVPARDHRVGARIAKASRVLALERAEEGEPQSPSSQGFASSLHSRTRSPQHSPFLSHL